MKNPFSFLFIFLTLTARAQIFITNTNTVIITGVYSAINGTYIYTNVLPTHGGGGYFQLPSDSSEIWINGGTNWTISGSFFTTPYGGGGNFPFSWTGSPPPSGIFLVTTNWASAVRWTYGMTNWFTVPGDSVSFSGSGRNMATNTAFGSVGLEILVDGNTVYTSSFTSGNGQNFTFDGSLQWDGTNLHTFAEMNSGDPSNPQVGQFYQFPTYSVGTNVFQLVSLNNTNGLVFLGATLKASRAPVGPYLPATNTVQAAGSANLQ